MIRPGLILFPVAILLLLAAGCASHSGILPASPNTTSPAPAELVSPAKETIDQPDASSENIRMGTDIYRAGDIVEFLVFNKGPKTLSSPNDHPDFSVRFQAGSGRWATRMGRDTPEVSVPAALKPGESSKVYRFVTKGWEAGRYRIVSDYGVEREFLLRAGAGKTPLPAPSCTPLPNASPLIGIDPIPDHFAGEAFAITGTSGANGTEIRYTVFVEGPGSSLIALGSPVPVTTSPGSCGISRWSADVMLPEAGNYLIGVSAHPGNASASALARFTILAAPAPAAQGRDSPLSPSGSPPVPPSPGI